MDYQQAGVNLAGARGFVEAIRPAIGRTQVPGVLGGIGGFGGYFQLPAGYQEPVLVAGTDGVGTKLKLAQILNKHDTIGIDLVAMCVNDVLTSNAKPLFFLDYVATGVLDGKTLATVVEGMTHACVQSGCALLGGETAEMPGFYVPGVYDLAGFCVGVVERRELLNGSQVEIGDVALGLASSGVHSNGYSLVRKILESLTESLITDDTNMLAILAQTPPELGGKTLGESLLVPTTIYVPAINALREQGIEIHGMAHITGGGLPENLPRCLGQNQKVAIQWQNWQWPGIFPWLAQQGNISESAMRETFNLGIGYVVVLPPAQVAKAQEIVAQFGMKTYIIGEVMG
ncbi:phosphoribosylformylglycinamidine cyclo-ligase [Gloeomargarita lithophora Alchichica-D10]|uniref:Phosphoribosylformylglycinamidine cyclo-ligase n=1 Tax=Gloeomargarita lithophora Alchichica-D10 TaxID=1188229 RepID=A0A1J0ABB6_9CYAN|nr:phosphoribosylformylglycinamidine cyclo-ligase [Gloeomargarita lithophora]APB33222.1 phosphoribosylformylglycinamidine cyclo-ligase [Gloeomargarita lithophora Alchichica-D10]